jgi:hypothetical protein
MTGSQAMGSPIFEIQISFLDLSHTVGFNRLISESGIEVILEVGNY